MNGSSKFDEQHMSRPSNLSGNSVSHLALAHGKDFQMSCERESTDPAVHYTTIENMLPLEANNNILRSSSIVGGDCFVANIGKIPRISLTPIPARQKKDAWITT